MKYQLLIMAAVSALSGATHADDSTSRIDRFAGLPTVRGVSPERYVCALGCGSLLINRVSDLAFGDRWLPFLQWRADATFNMYRLNGSLDHDENGWVARRVLVDPMAVSDFWVAHMPLRTIAAEFERSGLDVDSQPWRDKLAAWQPDPELLARELRVRREIATEKDCPAILGLVAALAPFEEMKLDIPGLGRDDLKGSPPDNLTFDGASHRITFNRAYVNRNMASFSVEGNYGSAPALWIEQAEATLEPCWKSEGEGPLQN